MMRKARQSGDRVRRLSCFGRPVHGPLHLLTRNENGLTYALGYVLSQSQSLMKELLRLLGVQPALNTENCELLLQSQSAEGITDLELHFGQVHMVLEAKKGGWPHRQQLERYAKKLASCKGTRVLCSLGVPPVTASPVRHWDPGAGTTLKHVRWIDILRMVRGAAKREGLPCLAEYAHFIQETLAMQAYDREVLVRDVKWGSESFDLFFRHRLYICQASEIAEPLFFAPCFSGDVERIHKGIHYFSRVYFRFCFALRDLNARRQAIHEAERVIDEKVRSWKNRKTMASEVKYLKELPCLWHRGLNTIQSRVPKGEERAVFFLGDPIPLPKPVFKKGKMIPLGFSVSLEQLMNGSESYFRC